MTIEAFEAGQKIQENIKFWETKKADIEKLLRRTKEVCGEHCSIVQIQLGEAYISTPKPYVDVNRFIEFLEKEAADMEWTINELKAEFRNL